MNKPTVLRNSAEPEVVIGIALKIYYNQNDWVSNAKFIEQLDLEYDAVGKEREPRNGGQLIAKYKPALYYGLLDCRPEDECKRINEYGKKYYEAYISGNQDQMVDCLLHAISVQEFGRNNAAVPKSDSDIEPPKVYLVSSLLLNGLNKNEYSYILEQLSQDRSYQVILVDVIVARQLGKELTISEYAKNNYGDDKGIKFLADAGLFEEKEGYRIIKPKYVLKYADILQNLSILNRHKGEHKSFNEPLEAKESTSYDGILTALRTKPFLLLAGISGTGKSRIVRELAFKSCPEFLRDTDGTTPGNYCMIEVKPNWHDSSELLGYYSHISKEYQYTNFIKFLVKAMMFPDVPFFVCLDEMNLAPVEQYFAEFLSVLETRKKVGDRIHTGAIVKPEYFKELQNAESGDGYIFTRWFPEIKRNIPYNIYTNPTLAQVGLTLPDNVFIIGTVNMDDTTHQFSRKVLDRAMTIEMNGGKLSEMFGQSHNLEYLPEEDIWDVNKFIPEYVTADEVIAVNPDTAEELKTKLPERLEEINEVLKDTPFVVSYRVLNELVIYTGNLLNDGMSIDEAIDEAVNQIVLMKILPRIEGDEDMFIVKGAAENRLEQLAHLVSGATKAKLEEMNNRLSTGFTRFWP